VAGNARTYLFVPGSRPERFDKALSSGADHVIVDLEDAVPPAQKAEALNSAAAWLGENRALVRINAAGTEWHDAELRVLAPLDGLLGIVVPKATPASAALVASAFDERRPIFPLVESADGILAVAEIAVLPSVARLMFGSLDLALDLGIDDLSGDEPGLLSARSTLALASAASGLPGPVDGVFADIADPDGLTRATRRARSLGFTAKLCIHPNQVDTVHHALAPTSADVAWARRVVMVEARTGGHATMEAGEMLDVPQYRRAARILAQLEPN
jgi:citrate lyase beta subunit